jgi:hypothetical protein
MHGPPPLPSEARRAARYEALLRVLQRLTAQRDPKALLRVLASELRHVVPFDGMAIVLYDEATSEVHLQMVEIVHQPSVVLPSDLPPEETMSS